MQGIAAFHLPNTALQCGLGKMRMTYHETLEDLAARQAAAFAGRGDLIACALTGSLARGMTWHGSDLDFWGFWQAADDDFEDGTLEGIYWEIDIKPLAWLHGWDAERFVQPPPFNAEEDGVTPLEALWGARVLFDHEGTLSQVVAQVQHLMSDKGWLGQRATNYLRYGRECLAALASEPPADAILAARHIAILYGVSAYWMKHGALLSSVMRIPERLADSPQIHGLLRQIFSLEGQTSWDHFLTAYQSLPNAVRAAFDDDLRYDVLPAAQRGMVEGALCHFRLLAADWQPFSEIAPVMGLAHDLTAHKAHILSQTEALLGLIEAL